MGSSSSWELNWSLIFSVCRSSPTEITPILCPSLTHPLDQTYLELNDLPLQIRIHLKQVFKNVNSTCGNGDSTYSEYHLNALSKES